MLDSILKKDFVVELIEQIVNNPKYYNKKHKYDTNFNYVLHEEVLILFYSSLYKYKIIIEEESYLKEYVNLVEGLLKRLNTIEDIEQGVSNIIGKLVARKLHILDINQGNSKQDIFNYIHLKYIQNGYYTRGISRKDYKNIKQKGLVKDIYLEEVNKLKVLSDKYHLNLFHNYHDNILLNTNIKFACLYSINSPIYLYNLLIDNKKIDDNSQVAYYLKDYDKAINLLNKKLANSNINEKDKQEVVILFNKLWSYYHIGENNIYLVLVKREKLDKEISEIKYNKEFDFYENLYKIFSTDNSYQLSTSLNLADLEFIEFPSPNTYIRKVKKKNKKKKVELVQDGFRFDNKYGKASICMILGAILIIIGVLLTIIG